ncbi:retrovirus-related pol polyprotein from transposon TNT 1-94 [Tanacetum coccineum]
MATLCMNSNLLPKTTIAKRISKPRKPSSKSYEFLFEYANRNHLLLPTNCYYLVAGDFSTTLLPPNSLNQRTVVLDLDETLIHSTIFRDTSIPITPPVNYDFLVTFGREVAYVKKRPYVDEFLQFLNQNNFEIVIFTAGTKEYASPVLDRLDPYGFISHRLYRDSRKLVNGKYHVKDLSNLGRDLRNVLIVDDKQRSYKLQPENGIPIKRFIDDLHDDELKKLMDNFFKSCDQYEDLKDALKHYRDLNLKLRFKLEQELGTKSAAIVLKPEVNFQILFKFVQCLLFRAPSKVSVVYHNLDYVFDNPLEIDVKWCGWEYRLKKMEKRVKKMKRFTGVICQLHKELGVLADLETRLTKMQSNGVNKGQLQEFNQKVMWRCEEGNVTSTLEDGNALCCKVTVVNDSRKRFANVWLFDTEATFHMTARKEWFHQYKPISGGGSVYSCNDHKLKIIGIGSIMVKMHDGTVRTIRDVRHVEGLKKNLLSLGQLDDLGCKVEIQNKIMKIIEGAFVLTRGEKVAVNLYELKGEIMKEAEASVASHSPSHRVAVTWHQKLGHMPEQGMKILVERKLLPGLTKVSLPFCEHCVISKQHRLKFKTSNSRSVYVLELVHSDVWQAPVSSLGGAKYFVSFIDDYSRRCWVYPIKKKSDVFEVFKVYKARVELDSGKKIKCLRTDNGGEYTGDEFDTFSRQEEIKRQFTTAYTPQQKGVAERMNITLLEKARAMLATASLRKSFWAEVVNTAYYVINRSPSTTVELKTPMEMWTGKPVNYSDFHIFGSLVYVMYNTQETTKLNPKSKKCLFLGYADEVKGYRLWDPTAHKVVVSRDVVFMEDKIQENEEGDSTTKETTSIQIEKEFQSNDSSEAIPQHKVNESNVAYCLLTEEGEPSTLQEALNNPDTKPIGNKWVYKIKRNGDDQVERYRARLVVKGYAPKEGIDFNEIFSPVVRMTTIRVVLSMCVMYDLHLEQLDVKTAFLYGNLEEEIYMLQPEGFKQKGKENLVCRLNKFLYGLKQAPRCWYKRFNSFFKGIEYNRLHADPCAYFKRFGNDDFIILLLYVDDMLVAGPNKYRINKLKAQLAREFKMKDLGPTNKILRMQIHRDRVSRKI